MIEFKVGDIFSEDAEALVNTVNCVGVMGRGVALQFKRTFPDNFKAYAERCKRHEMRPGEVFVFETENLGNPRYIINFPTKRHWRGKSRLGDIESGLNSLVGEVKERGIRSVALPPLGSGLGGLDWEAEVRPLLATWLAEIPGVHVVVFEPGGGHEDHRANRSTEVPSMTPARATLVALMDKYMRVLLDPEVTLLEVHKLMYFMQAAGEPLKLRFVKGVYGPYAENLRHQLNAVEGHFISGYYDGGDKPSKPLELVPGAVGDAQAVLESAEGAQQRLQRVHDLVKGFETGYGLELLSTVHWVAEREQPRDFDHLKQRVWAWNSRKRWFTEHQLHIAAERLREGGWIGEAPEPKQGMDDLGVADLGKRLRSAREHAGLTQAQAANAIEVARTTLAAIEAGKRQVRTEELRRLAQSYGESVNALVCLEWAHIDVLPRLRRAGRNGGPAATQAARVLANLVRAELELENLLGAVQVPSYPPEKPIAHGDISAQAESDAADMRHRLGIGSAPIRDIVSLLEIDLGIRVYVRPIDPSVSGAFAYDDAVGACVLLNAKHPRERRTFTAAHELGHFMSCRQTAEVTFDGQRRSRKERYADAFARAFLTPARTVMERFAELTRGSASLTRRHVIVMAHLFGVSRGTLVRRLEELGQVKPGAWDWFQANGGITNQQASEVLKDLIPDDVEQAGAKQPGSLRLNLLAAEAYRQDLMSEGQLAHLLRLDRIELREILDSVDVEKDVDGLPQLSR